jgi:hypothetical protein
MTMSWRSRVLRLFLRGVVIAVATACGDVTPPKDVLHLEGIVRNLNDAVPIQGAVVWTGSISGDTFLSRRIDGTDAQGHYSIDDDCTGNDYIKVQAPGFRDLLGPIECGPRRQTVDIALVPAFNP